MDEGLQKIWNGLSDTFGDLFSEETFKNLVDKIKSAATEENWNNLVATIKTGLKDVTDKEKIKTFLDSVKGQVKDTTGNVGKMIKCLENDINDKSCLENFTKSSAYSIQVRLILFISTYIL